MNRTAGMLLLGIGAAGLAGAAIHLAGASSRRRGLSRAVAGVLSEAASDQPTRAGRRTTAKTRVHAKKRMTIDERVDILRDVGHRSLQDPAMRKLALQITKHCQARDAGCEAKAIYDWVRKNIRYTGDIGPHHHGRKGVYEGVDLFQGPSRTVEFGGGDCDDHSLLVCNLAIANGFACTYRITGPSKSPNDDWSHIYPMLGMPKNDPKKLLALDTTLPGNMFGREAPYGKKRDYRA
jgi:hypothetical protein